MKRLASYSAAAAGLALLIILSLNLSNYGLNLIILIGFWIILASSLNLIVGYTGLVSLGHVAFYAIGAYSSALLTTKLQLSFWLALPLSVLIVILAGYLIGSVSLRFKGPFFAIVTLSFGEILRMIINNWTSLTEGSVGMRGVAAPDPILGVSFEGKAAYLYLITAAVVLTLLICRQLVRSKIGRAWVAIREDEELAESLGVNISYYKKMSFIVGSSLAGMAGALYAHYMHYISPSQFTVMNSVDVLIMNILGGAGTLLGPVLGVVILQVLDQALFMYSTLRFIIYGLLLMGVIIFLPKGLVGLLQIFRPRTGK